MCGNRAAVMALPSNTCREKMIKEKIKEMNKMLPCLYYDHDNEASKCVLPCQLQESLGVEK